MKCKKVRIKPKKKARENELGKKALVINNKIIFF